MAVSPNSIVVIGGGIVGLATAWQLSNRLPDVKIVVVEKEASVGHHQTGHNSGVLHSGIYYKPGSLKSDNCRLGKVAMQEFCEANEIPFDICGKVIVAVDETELPALEKIYQRGQQTGVQCSMIEQERLKELEPHVAGVRAIHVPESGIVNYRAVCERLAELLKEKEHQIALNSRVHKITTSSDKRIVHASTDDFETDLVINCAGLHCDRVSRLGGARPEARIVPFRGEYFELKPERHHLCRNLIYPVPDPQFPFLGVHFARMIDGSVECGPNAVLAMAREGYHKTSLNVRDLFESLTYGGFIKMALKHWKMGCGEMWRSFSKKAFVKALQRLMPEITADDLVAAPAGVRAQAITRDGKLVDDFLISESDSMINVINAPSPAATASLNIGNLVADKVSKRL